MTKQLTPLPANQPRKRRDRSAPGRVTGRLKAALDSMIWQNLTDNEAAVKFKITVQAIRMALKRPHVLRYLKEERVVLHAREFARNSHALIEVRDQTANQMARVAAVRALEQSDTNALPLAGKAAPGFVIIVAPAAPPAVTDPRGRGPIIEVKANASDIETEGLGDD
jgi:hypothetical protein